VLGLLLVSLWLRATAPVIPEPVRVAVRPSSIAVLPFINTNPDSADDYLGPGFATELTRALGTLPGLSVAALPFTRGGGTDDPLTLGHRLEVGTILEGTIRRAGDRLRITAHLMDVGEGFDLWSETYERLPGDIYAVKNEIAQAVVAALRVPGADSLPAAPAPTLSLEAYLAYLRARHAMARPGAADPSRAAGLYQEAIRLDSSFAPAWAGLAAAQAQRAIAEGARPADAMPAARTAAIRALALDSTLGVAHATIGLVRFLYDWEWGGADSAFQRALVVDPDLPETRGWYARLLLALGRRDEALAQARRALELTPLDPETIAQLGWLSLYVKRYRDARENLERALALDPSLAGTRHHLGLLAEVLGDYELTESHYRGALDRAPADVEVLASIGRAHALDGRPDDARAVLAQLDSLSAGRYVSPYLLAGIAEALGDTRRAFAWLEEAEADRAGQLVYLSLDPRLDRLRGDRRFARIRRSVGLP
jgi:serine/threonine-protein kinase